MIPFLALPGELRRTVYTTNTIEGLHRQVRKAIKTRGHFPDQQAAKLIYLALIKADAKWQRNRAWTAARARLKIHFETDSSAEHHQPVASASHTVRRTLSAVTTEHSMPVLEAAHIRPWGFGGAHDVPNGIPLRRDLHRLFDLGYLTIRPDLRLAVSSTLREDYENGRTYYELDRRRIQLPGQPADHPDRELLEWHNATIYRG